MGLDTWWTLGSISEKEAAPLRGALKRAQSRPLSRDVVMAHRRWRERLNASMLRDDHAAFLVPFVPLSSTEDEIKVPKGCETISLCKQAAPAVLFYGLGPQGSQLLPGLYGNMVIPANKVRQAARQVDQVLAEVDPRHYKAKAEELLLQEEDPAGIANDILRALPDALALAQADKRSFFAICFGP